MSENIKRILDKLKIPGRSESEEPEVQPLDSKHTFAAASGEDEESGQEESMDSWEPTLTKSGSSEGVVIPKKWIDTTGLKRALRKIEGNLKKRMVMELHKNPGDCVWGYRVILEFRDREAAE